MRWLSKIPTITNPNKTQFISCVSTACGDWYFIQLRHKHQWPLAWLRDRTLHVYIIPASMIKGNLVSDDQSWDLAIMKLWHDCDRESLNGNRPCDACRGFDSARGLG